MVRSDKINIFTNHNANAQLLHYTMSKQKVVTLKKILSKANIFNSGFINEIQNPSTNKTYEKSCLMEQTHNKKD